MIQKNFQPSLDQLNRMLEFVSEQCHEAGFYESHLYQIELAVEEILVNILHHASLQKSGSIQIECTYNEHKQFSVVISDDGLPFNPLDVGKRFDISAMMESKLIGGYGICFVLKIIDEIQYRYENGQNILTLVKYG